MTASTPTTIVLIHGLWMTPLSWEKWIKRFSNKGHTAIAPGWPGVGDDIQALRKDPSGLRADSSKLAFHSRASSMPIRKGATRDGLPISITAMIRQQRVMRADSARAAIAVIFSRATFNTSGTSG